MGLASTLVVKVARCAWSCSLHNLAASLYDRVLLSDMRLVMHMTIWRFADTGRGLGSVARAPSAAHARPIAAMPHTATFSHLHIMRIPDWLCPSRTPYAPVWRAFVSDQGVDIRRFRGVVLTEKH